MPSHRVLSALETLAELQRELDLLSIEEVREVNEMIVGQYPAEVREIGPVVIEPGGGIGRQRVMILAYLRMRKP
jgi:glycyl-tRNA synthetase (class II)